MQMCSVTINMSLHCISTLRLPGLKSVCHYCRSLHNKAGGKMLHNTLLISIGLSYMAVYVKTPLIQS